MFVYYQTFITGILATVAMTAVLYLIHWRGLANADMIRAVGSMVTRSEENAVVPGIVIHFISGVVFAFVYIAFWSMLRLESYEIYPVLGVITGFGHGLVVSFLLVSTVSERHPLERFRETGVGVAVAHLAGHVVFGLVVGLLAGFQGIRYDFIPTMT